MPRAVLCTLLAVSSYAATPLFQGSFDGSAQKWTAIRGSATVDSSVRRAGRNSLRVESSGSGDACIRSAPISLVMGRRYELSGWVRTEGVNVRDVDRTPIATGATMSMASMPFDVHAASIGGTHDWTRLTLQFTATRSNDEIQLSAGNGGAFTGKVWFEGVSIDEASDKGAWPAPEAVTHYGPAYRYPYGGWIYLHIEGKPYERGYQHGHLMAKEIPQYLERCMADLGYKDDEGWQHARMVANSMFLRGFDNEILEEMKGIADGAAENGARFHGRSVDLLDIVTANVEVEMGELREALEVTPNGLERLRLSPPDYRMNSRDRCSAFAATGPATRDGKMVIGHVTWWPLTLAEQTNVMLDIKPEQGHRMLIQSYPGGIESGTDWYQNDAGVVLTETTIRQSPFNAQGTPVAYRARKAIQYGDNIDKVVEILSTRNNGLYTNEWLIGDAKTNEIAMFELGTSRTKLWRSSKHEWFAGTEGFYWGNNNAKDLSVRLEEKQDPQSAPEYVPFVPTQRDLAWQKLYHEYRGKIDDQFGFLAFRTAPLVSSMTMDAKVATADMASRMMVWAEFGKPNQTAWVPQEWEKKRYGHNDGLYPSGYRLFEARSTAPETAPPAGLRKLQNVTAQADPDGLWTGWVLPASDADIWFVAGSAAYHRDLESGRENIGEAHAAAYRRLQLEPANDRTRYELQLHKGVVLLDSLRRNMGDAKFFKLMRDYFAANTTKTVTAQSFLNAAGVPFKTPDLSAGPVYLTRDIDARAATALIVYGTGFDAGANRYAAEQVQKQLWAHLETEVPIRKDFELTDEELRTHDVIFVGRPETNSALASIASRIGLTYDQALFRIRGAAHGGEREALAYAATNPLNPAHMVLALAANDALDTVKLASAQLEPAQYVIYDSGKESEAGFSAQAR